MTGKCAEPTLTNRRHSMWGKCEICGQKDILSIKGNSSGLYLVCTVCSDVIAFVMDEPTEYWDGMEYEDSDYGNELWVFWFNNTF